MDNIIDKKIEELFSSLPEGMGISFGLVKKNGAITGETGFVFLVKKKLPLDQLSEDDILPKEIIVDSLTIRADVQEIGTVELMCSCTQFNPNVESQRFRHPIQGGMEITTNRNYVWVDGYGYAWSRGTMGFIAVDQQSGGLVGVTNNHVVVPTAFYTSVRNSLESPNLSITPLVINDSIEDLKLIQPYNYTNFFEPMSELGYVLRYVPLNTSGNRVDAALVSLMPFRYDLPNVSTIELSGASASWKQLGDWVPIQTAAMPFATTSEINGLVNTQAGFYGRTSGLKQGDFCGVRILSVNTHISGIYYDLRPGYGPNENNPTRGRDTENRSISFQNLIQFENWNTGQCSLGAIRAGDSGSALCSYIDGVWKIIGLNFAGYTDLTGGFACRIDHVANELGIESWDGTTPNFITRIDKLTVNGFSSNKKISTEYWQAGLVDSARS